MLYAFDAQMYKKRSATEYRVFTCVKNIAAYYLRSVTSKLFILILDFIVITHDFITDFTMIMISSDYMEI